MIRRVKKKIGDGVYEGNTLPATVGVTIGAKLLKLVGPSAGKLAGSGSLKDIVDGKAAGELSSALEIFATRLNEDEILKLAMEMLQGLTRFGPVEEDEGGNPLKPIKMEPSKRKDFDIVYSANYGELIHALAFVMEANLKSFFGDGRIGKVWGTVSKLVDDRISQLESDQPSSEDSTQS